MNLFAGLMAVCFFLVGIFAVISTKSDIQLILAALCFGFGTLTVLLAGIGASVRR